MQRLGRPSLEPGFAKGERQGVCSSSSWPWPSCISVLVPMSLPSSLRGNGPFLHQLAPVGWCGLASQRNKGFQSPKPILLTMHPPSLALGFAHPFLSLVSLWFYHLPSSLRETMTPPPTCHSARSYSDAKTHRLLLPPSLCFYQLRKKQNKIKPFQLEIIVRSNTVMRNTTQRSLSSTQCSRREYLVW